jgi:hypothetical protein
MSRMLVVRVWLPDRPGALGQVASRIGAVHGDVTAIDILERGAGRVIDELVVSLPDDTSDELLAAEIRAVDGVSVEHIRPIGEARADAATAILEVAAHVAGAAAAERLPTLVDGLLAAFDADWSVGISAGELIHRAGRPPELGWLVAFLEGCEHLDSTTASVAPGDVMWARLPRSGIAIAVGRTERPVHERERARVELLARITDALI